VAVAAVLTGAAWMGLWGEAHGQVQIMPAGPLSVRDSRALVSVELGQESNLDKVYPGRTMGGGPRILRSNPPPSSLKRRREE
jgi:hypothetical protein